MEIEICIIEVAYAAYFIYLFEIVVPLSVILVKTEREYI